MSIFATKSIQNLPLRPLFTLTGGIQGGASILDPQGVIGITDPTVTMCADLTTVTIDTVHVATLSLGQMNPAAVVAAFVSAGILDAKLDFLGRLVFPSSVAVTAGDSNTRTILGI
jgi:hypothetical protein